MRPLSHSAKLALLLLLVVSAGVTAQAFLTYQNRGSYHEGIKPSPVGGADIELISARIDYSEPANEDPESIKVRFYLPTRSHVYLTVRELQVRHYYWLDRVVPSDRWQSGFGNVFEWSTRPVLRQLRPRPAIDDFAVVARLERPEPGDAERVAPVFLYHSEVPDSASAYLFILKLNVDARLNADVYDEATGERVFTQAFPRERGGRPFTVRWAASTAAKGAYRLVISGYSLLNNAPIGQTVRFYHQPRIEDG